jgi:predicted transcriptional regulator
MTDIDASAIVGLTAEIVAAYVSNNRLPAAGLPDLIAAVSGSVRKLGDAAAEPEPAQAPAVNPKRSVFPDYIICLEDGKKFKSMKRHLSVLGLSPDEYRTKWSLGPTYPMVAPNYATERSNLAKKAGLGRKAAVKPKPKSRRTSKAK